MHAPQRQRGKKQDPREISYAQFLQAMGGKRTPKLPSEKRDSAKWHPQKSTQLTAKCLTEITDNGQTQPTELHDYSNREPGISQHAFRSIEHFHDCQPLFAEKENTFVQARSHSRKKDGRMEHAQRSCEEKEASGCGRNEEGVAHYLLSEIRMIVRELTKFNRERITYMDFLEMLRELNMIQSNYEPQRNDVVSRLWAIVTAGSKENTTCLINLSIMVLAVMKISVRVSSVQRFFENVAYSLDSLRPTAANFRKAAANQQREYHRDREGYFDLTREQVLSIYQQFKELRITRMFLGRIGRKSEKLDECCQSATSFPFRPQITEKSRSLAKRKKEKEHFNSVSNDIVEFQIQTERQIKEMEECTFQPKTSRSRPIAPEAGVKRSQILYRLGKSSRSKERKERRHDEIQFQRNPDSFTFKPQVSKTNRSQERKKPVMGEGKQIDRMIRARVEKEVREHAMKKGLPYNQRCFDKLRREISTKYLRELQHNHQTKGLHRSFQKKSENRDSTREQSHAPSHTQSHMQSQQHTSSVESSVQSQLPFEEPSQAPRREIFTFEVYLEEDTCFDRITMYEGDEPSAVAHAFIVKHKLKSQLETKLAKTLRGHLTRLTTGRQSPNLCEIEEQSVECSLEI